MVTVAVSAKRLSTERATISAVPALVPAWNIPPGETTPAVALQATAAVSEDPSARVAVAANCSAAPVASAAAAGVTVIAVTSGSGSSPPTRVGAAQ